MSPHFKLVLLVIISQISYIVGEFLFKQGMALDHGGWRKNLLPLGGGLLGVVLSFFLWLGLMSKADLSYLYPFQSLNVIIVTLGAAIFFKEKLTWQLILGMLLIAGGAALVFES